MRRVFDGGGMTSIDAYDLDGNATSTTRRLVDLPRVLKTAQIEGRPARACTGRSWPRYTDQVISKRAAVLREIGDYYDAHHIIENAYGGPHVWWNLHPARFPNEHQGGLHRSLARGGVVRRIFQ